jgi:tetratricopeptide (TPR) repeat protein
MDCLDETTTLDLLEGKLPPDREAEVKLHLDECEDCRELLAAMAKSTISDAPGNPAAPLDRGRSVGRYIVLDVLGAGGMGIVYSAYDPELDRKIALKLLRGDSPDNDDLQRRLLREAQAMARLSHPNVVTVFDVGTTNGQVFVAMEQVEGVALGQWLREAPPAALGDHGHPAAQPCARPWREVLSVYALAGRGLAAAHAAGIVHRDFKPDNVIVGQDGRVRVTDFGLARTLGAGGAPGGAAPTKASKVIKTPFGNLQVTRPGTLAGTPAYMAPEQMRGEPTDARSDQFSFCVALWEGLYHDRPFGADSNFANLREALLHGRLHDPPPNSKVPAWLRRVLVRGLSTRPEDRYPSMDALLEALVPPEWKVRRRIIVAFALLTTLVAAVLGYRARYEQDLMCHGAQRKLQGVWDSERKRAVHQAFAQTGLPFAEDAWKGASRQLDDFAREWTQMHTEACEATRLRGEQSEELMDLRVECLDRHLREVGAVTRLFSEADAKIVERAVEVAESLPGLEECANAALLRASVRAPKDPITTERVETVRTSVARVRALEQAGKYKEALDPATKAVEAARSLEYLPVEAEALHVLGRVYGGLDDAKNGEAALREAASAAELAGHFEVAARAWIDMIYFIGNKTARYEESHPWNRYAMAAIERLGGNDTLDAERLNAHSIILWRQGREQPALEELQRALALHQKRVDDVAVARTLDGIAAVYVDQGRLEEALDLDQQAVSLSEKTLGSTHPTVAIFLNNAGNEYYYQGRHAEALVALRRALAIYDKALGPNHPSAMAPLDTTGTVLAALGEYDEAFAFFARARKILEDSGRKDNPDYAAILNDTAETHRMRGEYEIALAQHKEALADLEKALGPEHPETGMCLYKMGEALMGLGRYNEALALDQKALAVVEKALGGESLGVAAVLVGIGRAHVGAGEPEKAIEPLERAIRLRTARPSDPKDLAEARFALARAKWGANRDGGSARQLASEARETFARSTHLKDRLAAVDAWLAGL